MPSGPWLLALEVKPLWCGFAFLVGLAVGSFANVCIHRLPRGISVVSPPSRCPGCASRIAAWDNVPLFSYLLLGGRCRSCRTPISIRYPGVEAANGLMYAGVALLQGPTAGAVVSMAFLTALLVLALIDLEWHILPNRITRPGIVAGILTSVWATVPTPLGTWLHDHLCPRLCLPAPALESAGAAALGYSCVAAITGLAWSYYRLVRKETVEPMGQGDWKLMAMIGAFRGTQGMWTGGFLGTLFGSVYGIGLLLSGRGTGRTPIPLGTFLCAGSALELFAGAQLLAWYRGLFGLH
jgi:leader peptidase (prepilin peptidase)/N-methyltransferase